MSASTSDAADRFRRIADAFDRRLGAVPAGAWSLPSPCAGWTARDVVVHLTEWVPSVIGRSGLEFACPPATDDPVAAWRCVRETLQRALDDSEIAAREFDAGPPGRLTIGDAIDRLVTGDVLIHTWDVARAVGLDEHLDDELVATMLEQMKPMDQVLRASGHFGPKVDLDEGASTQDELIAFTGRDPRRVDR